MTLIIDLNTLLNNIDTIKQSAMSVRVLYLPSDTLTIENYLALQSAKLKVDFVPMPDMKDEKISAGYLIGSLTAETTSTVVVTNSEPLLSTGSILAKGNAMIYFVADLKQAQKIEKTIGISKKRTPRKASSPIPTPTPAAAAKIEKAERKPSKTKKNNGSTKTENEDAENIDLDGFMNLPAYESDEVVPENENEKAKAILTETIGRTLTNRYFSAIMETIRNATEVIGWEILLRIKITDAETSSKIYEKVAPRFKELKTLIDG